MGYQCRDDQQEGDAIADLDLSRCAQVIASLEHAFPDWQPYDILRHAFMALQDRRDDLAGSVH